MHERFGLAIMAGSMPNSVSHRTFRREPALARLPHRTRRWLTAASLTLLSIAGLPAHAQAPSTPAAPVNDAQLLSIPPRTWAADAAKNELVALHHKDSYLRYRMHAVNEKGDLVRDVIESKDGTVARLILKDGKPLTKEQDDAERQRLNDMIASPATYLKHVKNGESDRKIADTIVPMMPDAMIYTYTPGQPQIATNSGTPQIVLDYQPNPKFVAPNTEAEALSGLQGRMWIDAKTHYLVRMEGTIFRPVNLGWGVLAHIYPGGKLMMNQADAGNNRWLFTSFSMELSVRALMVKTLKVQSHVESSGYQTLSAMSYQDAVRLLLDTPLPTHP
jgi:hypothetical protein